MAHQGQCSGQVSLNLANLDFQGLTRFLSQGLLRATASLQYSALMLHLFQNVAAASYLSQDIPV